MKKISTLIDKNSTKEFSQGTFIFALVAFVIALGIIALYIIFGVLNNSWLDLMQIVLVVLGGVLVVLCVLIVINYLNAIKKMEGFERTIVYDFLDDAVTYDIYREEEIVENGKIYYEDILDYKMTKSYVFLRLKNNSWLGVKKEEGLIEFIKSKGIFKHSSFRTVRK